MLHYVIIAAFFVASPLISMNQPVDEQTMPLQTELTSTTPVQPEPVVGASHKRQRDEEISNQAPKYQRFTSVAELFSNAPSNTTTIPDALLSEFDKDKPLVASQQPQSQPAPSFLDAVSNYFPFNIKPTSKQEDKQTCAFQTALTNRMLDVDNKTPLSVINHHNKTISSLINAHPDKQASLVELQKALTARMIDIEKGVSKADLAEHNKTIRVILGNQSLSFQEWIFATLSNYPPFNFKPAQDATDVSSSESEQEVKHTSAPQTALRKVFRVHRQGQATKYQRFAPLANATTTTTTSQQPTIPSFSQADSDSGNEQSAQQKSQEQVFAPEAEAPLNMKPAQDATDVSSSESERSESENDQQQQLPSQAQPASSFVDVISSRFPFNMKPAQDATDVSSSESERSESENDQQQQLPSQAQSTSFFSTLLSLTGFSVEIKKTEVLAQLNTLSLTISALNNIDCVAYHKRIIAQLAELNATLNTKKLTYFTLKRILSLVTLANQQMQLGAQNKDLVLTNLQCALDELSLLENK